MSHPEHLQISIQTVFQLFSQQNHQALTRPDLMKFLNFVFAELGINRPPGQTDLISFLREIDMQSQDYIQKECFGEQKFIKFNRFSNHNPSAASICEIKIPIQPFIEQLDLAGSQVISREMIRQFLANINSLLQIPKPVQDQDVQKFISDFDRNGDGQLETKDLKGIQCLKFITKKCRRYE